MQTLNANSDPVLSSLFFSLFVFVFCFLGMNEVSLLHFILPLKRFLEVESGCMGTVKSNGDSSQILV